MIEKVVIPAAGLGTRLLSATKEQPKEMLPVFAVDRQRSLCVRPLVQLIFEQLFDFGARRFCFVVGRGKRAIEDHFTPDPAFIQDLNSRGRDSQATELGSFYKKIQESNIVWVNQPEPMGFGHAVLQAESLVSSGPFLVHAGDTHIISKAPTIVERLTRENARGSANATLTLQEVPDTSQYGVAEADETEKGNLIVKRVVEKPSKPRSNLAIMPLYIFNRNIFEALKATPPDKRGEIQLTDAIQNLIEMGSEVHAIKLREGDIRLDIGTPETYWEALQLSHKHASAMILPSSVIGKK